MSEETMRPAHIIRFEFLGINAVYGIFAMTSGL